MIFNQLFQWCWRGALGERAYDIYSLLLKERIVFVGSAINDRLQMSSLHNALPQPIDPE